MPIQINGTTVIDETLLADINMSNLSETGINVIKNLVEGQGVMKRPDYSNATQNTISCSCKVSKNGAVSNISYTSFTINSTGYISLSYLPTSIKTSSSITVNISNQQVKINNKLVTNDVLKNSLVPVSANNSITFTASLEGTSIVSDTNVTFTIAEFMFYPEL